MKMLKNNKCLCIWGVLLILATLLFISGIRVSYVNSESMEPTIPTNSMIITASVHNTEKLQKEDIVVYCSAIKEINICHRIIAVGDKYVITKGDSNKQSDGKIPKEYVNQKYIFNIPCFGFLAKILQKKVVLIGLLLILFSLPILLSKRKEN